jgi:hypothetical protein
VEGAEEGVAGGAVVRADELVVTLPGGEVVPIHEATLVLARSRRWWRDVAISCGVVAIEWFALTGRHRGVVQCRIINVSGRN